MLCEALEDRVFLSASVYQPSQADRRALAAVMAEPLRTKLLNIFNGKAGVPTTKRSAAFDATLLSWMRAHSEGNYFFDAKEANSVVATIKSNLGVDNSYSDKVVAHQFKDGSNWITVTPSDSMWTKAPSSAKGTEFINYLNRMDWWDDLALSYKATGNSKYLNELRQELGTFARQESPLADWNKWREGNTWSQLDTSKRVENWMSAYFLLLRDPKWTGADNTLFLREIYFTGDFLNRSEPDESTLNKRSAQGAGLMYIARGFPFAASEQWKQTASDRIDEALSLGGQFSEFRSDGFTREQSPGYGDVTTRLLVDQASLAHATGDDFSKKWRDRLMTILDASYQMLNPDGKTPAFGDTYRTYDMGIFSRASLVFGGAFPQTRPSATDVQYLWQYRYDIDYKPRGFVATPSDRGNAYDLNDAGYYVMRSAESSGDPTSQRQLIFDTGPVGNPDGTGHGHFDLLSFELYGYGKPLITNPGPYQYPKPGETNSSILAKRNWVLSTPAQNTISVDGYSHADVEGPPGYLASGVVEANGGLQVTGRSYAYQDLRGTDAKGKKVSGKPVIARSIWFDQANVFVVVDWGKSVNGGKYDYTQSFTVPGTTSSTSSGSDGEIHTLNPNSANVMIKPVGRLPSKQSTFISTDSAHLTDSAVRITTGAKTTSPTFATVIVTYKSGSDTLKIPQVSARFLETPQPGKPVKVRLYYNDGKTTSRTLVFNPGSMVPLKESPGEIGPRVISSSTPPKVSSFSGSATAGFATQPIAHDVIDDLLLV
jgi:hypothetical protein